MSLASYSGKIFGFCRHSHGALRDSEILKKEKAYRSACRQWCASSWRWGVWVYMYIWMFGGWEKEAEAAACHGSPGGAADLLHQANRTTCYLSCSEKQELAVHLVKKLPWGSILWYFQLGHKPVESLNLHLPVHKQWFLHIWMNVFLCLHMLSLMFHTCCIEEICMLCIYARFFFSAKST